MTLSYNNKHQNIELLVNGGVQFIGETNEAFDSASVQSDISVPNIGMLRATYYFEINVLSGGDLSEIGIGLSEENSDLNALPGWMINTYGYHGEDGKIFAANGRGRPYGPTYTTNDIVGCGYNVKNRSCFFTKNGKHLGIAFKDVSNDVVWFPTIGLQSIGSKVEVNFGSKPFAYNIELENILQEAHQKDLEIT